MTNDRALMLGALGVGAGLVAASVMRNARNVGQALGEGAAGAAIGAGEGVVLGVGDAVGIPRTDDDQCTIDLANGDLWAASFSCPAGRYIEAALKQANGG